MELIVLADVIEQIVGDIALLRPGGLGPTMKTRHQNKTVAKAPKTILLRMIGMTPPKMESTLQVMADPVATSTGQAPYRHSSIFWKAAAF